MKQRFIFIRSMNGFSVNDVVYHVWVGTSKRDQVTLSLVQEYAQDCGIFFEPYSENVGLALNHLAESLMHGSFWARLSLRRADLEISELYKLIVDDSFDSYESNLFFKPAHFHLLSLISPSYYLSNKNHFCNTSCHALRRKYLSLGDISEGTRVTILVGLILALIASSMYLESIERYFY